MKYYLPRVIDSNIHVDVYFLHRAILGLGRCQKMFVWFEYWEFGEYYL